MNSFYSDMQGKKVSIIIPCYNQAQYVSEAIESALNQTYQNVEIVVINDASTDNSSDVIKSYADKYPNIIFLDEKDNKGVVKSRNLAISKSSGNYILPVDADDKIASTFCEKAVKILDSDLDIRIVYSRIQFFGFLNKEFKLEDFNPDRIIFNNCIPNTAMYRKSDFVAVGGYHDYMKDGWEDWNMWLSILEIAPNKEKCAYKIDEILYFYRQFESGTRSDFKLKKQNELFVNMIANHPSLYKDRIEFYRHILKTLPAKMARKKKLIKNLVMVVVIQLVVVIALLVI